MKKYLMIIAVVLMAVSFTLAGCTSGGEPQPTPKPVFEPEEPSGSPAAIQLDSTTSAGAVIVEFGKYPAVQVTDEDVLFRLDSLGDADRDGTTGYYSYGDGLYHKEVKVNKDENTGLEETFTYWFEVQPIRWVVFDKGDGNIHLISENNIDAMQYNTQPEGVNWAVSTLRDWLNSMGDYASAGFLNTAFS